MNKYSIKEWLSIIFYMNPECDFNKKPDFYVLFFRKANSTEHPSRGYTHLVLISQLIRLKQRG